MKYSAIKIPFSTKAKSKYKITGDAFYLINNNLEIIKQFIQVKQANYRPTDKEMLTSNYYCNGNKRIILRKKFLEKVNPLILSKKTNEPQKLNDNDIKLINIELLNINRVKSSIDILTGSNSSGAELFPSKVEIIYSDEQNKDSWCNGINFSNPLNNLLIKNYKNIANEIKINLINEDLNIIKFCDIFSNEKYSKIENEISKYNNIIFYMKDEPMENIIKNSIENYDNFNERINLNELQKIKKIDKEKYYSDAISTIIAQYEYNIISENICERRLRNIQKSLLRYQITDLKKEKKDFSINFLQDDKISNLTPEHAHIVSVKSCKQEKRFNAIADPHNCIIISPNIHSLFDCHEMTFNHIGEAIIKSKKNFPKLNIKKIYLTHERKKYLIENYDHYKFYNKNK